MIDIVGLQISTAEFLWTVVSFFLFMFLLKKFLFDPILTVMDARNAKIKEGLAEGKSAEKALNDSKAQLAAELSVSGSEARALISDAKARAEKEKSAVLAASHAEADKVRKDVYRKVGSEEKAAREAIGAQMPELVSILTGRLLGDGAELSDELIRESIESSEA